jgi:hypothetical protein
VGSGEDEDWHYSNAVVLTAVAVNGRVKLPGLSLEPKDDGKYTLTLSGITDGMKESTDGYHIAVDTNDDDMEDHTYWLPDKDYVKLEELEGDIATITFDTGALLNNEGDEDTVALRHGAYCVHVHANAKTGWSNNWTDDSSFYSSTWFGSFFCTCGKR